MTLCKSQVFSLNILETREAQFYGVSPQVSKSVEVLSIQKENSSLTWETMGSLVQELPNLKEINCEEELNSRDGFYNLLDLLETKPPLLDSLSYSSLSKGVKLTIQMAKSSEIIVESGCTNVAYRV